MTNLLWYFLTLGATGFGGPIALVSRMEHELVTERALFSRQEFADGLTLAQIAPGPLAAQLAMYLGWLRGGVWGSALVAIAFILPSLLIVMGLSLIYERTGEMPMLRQAFYGVGAAVIALLARGATRLARRAAPAWDVLALVAGVNAIAVVATGRELVLFLLISGLLPLIVDRARRSGTAPLAVLAMPFISGASGDASKLTDLAYVFGKASLVVFGSGLAIVPFLHGEVVGVRGWLSESQFLDAIAVAMLTPGPVVITVAFIGWIVAGPVGAIVSAAAIFLPTWLAVLLTAPWYQRLTSSAVVRRVVQGISAAAAGALGGAVVVLASRSIVDLPTIVIALASLALLRRWPKIPEPLVLAAAALVGLALGPGR